MIDPNSQRELNTRDYLGLFLLVIFISVRLYSSMSTCVFSRGHLFIYLSIYLVLLKSFELAGRIDKVFLRKTIDRICA